MKANPLYRRLMRILPLYASAYAVLLCALGAYAATSADERFGAQGAMVVLAGFGVSVFCRLYRLRQNTMFGILAAMVVVMVFWISQGLGGHPVDAFITAPVDRPVGPGTMLAWFVVLYSFAMVADEVIVFSIVPSIALIGLMASENLNPEIVVYFVGLVLSAVFLLIYDNVLAHNPEVQTDADEVHHSAPRGSVNLSASLRPPLLLSACVMGLAMAIGLLASMPLRVIGASISDNSQQLRLPSATELNSSTMTSYMNQVDLSGAPPHLTDRVVMEVKSERPLYWRARVFEEYTGFSWNNESRPRLMQRDSNNVFRTRGLRTDPELGEMRGRRRVRQEFRLVSPPISGVLACAGEPMTIESAAPLAEDQNHCLQSFNGRATRRYTVESLVPAATPRQLMQAGTAFPLSIYGYTIRTTSLGKDERLAIAKAATKGMLTQYEKVTALEEYLRANYEYSLTPPRTPPGEDAVTFFLTKSKIGYCEAFASALAVLCRDLEIPARLVTGFAPGSPEISTNGEEVLIVRERDLHAWTEVYFAGYGWIPFDATSSRVAQNSWWNTLREGLRDFLNSANARTGGPLLVMFAIGGLMLSLMKWYVVDPLQRSFYWKSVRVWLRGRKAEPATLWDMRFAKIYRRLRKTTGIKQAHQTPYEYAEIARKSLSREAADALDALTRLYVKCAFQRGGPKSADFEGFADREAALTRALRTNG